MKHGDGAFSIEDPRGRYMSQYDGTWARSGYFLRWKRRSEVDPDHGIVDFVIFSPSQSLRCNLESLLTRSDYEQATYDPFCLLVVVLDHMFRQVDSAIWDVNKVFSEVERVNTFSLID